MFIEKGTWVLKALSPINQVLESSGGFCLLSHLLLYPTLCSYDCIKTDLASILNEHSVVAS